MVAIPIAAIAVLASDVTGDSQAGKSDASLATGLEAAIALCVLVVLVDLVLVSVAHQARQ